MKERIIGVEFPNRMTKKGYVRESYKTKPGDLLILRIKKIVEQEDK